MVFGLPPAIALVTAAGLFALDRFPIILVRHSRESGNLGASDLTIALGPRFRGGDESPSNLIG